MAAKVALDTNVLIDDPKVVFDDSSSFCIPFMVIRELDNLKRNPQLKRAAQAALKNINIQYTKGLLEVLDVPKTLGSTPDEIIVQSAKDASCSLLSGDLGANIIARAHGVPVSDFEVESTYDPSYKGYIRIQGTVEYEKEFVQIKEMQLGEFNTQFSVDLKENQYCIIDRVVEKDDIWYNSLGTVTRISQSAGPLKDAGIMSTPMDSEQMCALHAVMNPDVPLVVLDGQIGVGKSIVALMGVMACVAGQKRHKHYTSIVVSKPPVSTNKDLYTGFKPGTREEKMAGHLVGLKSNLKFLMDKPSEKPKFDKDGNKVLTTADVAWSDYFEVLEIDEAQGASLHETVWIIDEWQLLDEDAAKMCMSRISGGSKLVLVGDTAGQTYGMNRAHEGFKPLFEWMGKDEAFSYIKLDNIYRSRLSEFVATVYK